MEGVSLYHKEKAASQIDKSVIGFGRFKTTYLAKQLKCSLSFPQPSFALNPQKWIGRERTVHETNPNHPRR
jgi:hypothetical protein